MSQPTTHSAPLLLVCSLALVGACAPELCVGDCDGETDDTTQEELASLQTCEVQSTIDLSTCGDGVAQPGEICFGPGSIIPLPGEPYSELAGDFNGDGLMDVLWNDRADEIRGLAGAAVDPLSTALTGTPFASDTEWPVLTGVGDFNADGMLDVVGENSGAFLLPGDGAGGFAPPQVLYSNSIAWNGPIVIDEDLDGDLDLAIVDPNQEPNEDNYTLVNDGTGVFTASPRTNNGNTDMLGDLDGEGPLDYINHSGSTLHILALGAAGETRSSLSFAADYLRPFGVHIVDLDGNGRSDVVARVLDRDHRNSEGFSIYAAVAVFLSDGPPIDGSPTFDAGAYFPMDCGMSQMVMGDIDGDGILDIVASHYAEPDSGQSASIVVRRGDGLGGFEAVARFPAPVGIDSGGSSLLGDFDGNGRMDVVVFNGPNRQLILYRGTL